MKILFLTEGGKRFGFGHLTRCVALAQAFRAQGKSKIKFLVNGDVSAKQFLKLNGETCIQFNWIQNNAAVFECAKESNLVLIDSYYADLEFFKKLNKSALSFQTVAIDDFNRIPYPTNFVINPSLDGEMIRHPKSGRTRYLSGSKFVMLRKPFWNCPKFKVKKSIRNVLITFGGTNQTPLIKSVVRTLATNMKNNVYFRVVSPFKYRAQSSRIIFYQNVNASQLRRLIQTADVGIAACGQTLNELACMGLPTAGIGFGRDQAPNVRAWKKQRFLQFAGWRNDPALFIKLSHIFKKLSDAQTRKSISKAGVRAIDGKGVERIVQYLIQNHHELKLRRVKVRDCLLLYKWRNHPLIRKNSFNVQKIDYKQHVKWFYAALKNPRLKIYLAISPENKNKIVGVIRLSQMETLNRVSVYLNPKLIGYGYGAQVISLGTQRFIKETRTKNPIMAEIKTSNVGSRRAFEKAGYVCEKVTGKSCEYAFATEKMK